MRKPKSFRNCGLVPPLVGLVVLAGCSSGAQTRRPHPADTSSIQAGGAQPTGPASTSARLGVSTVATFPLRAWRTVSHLALVDGHVVFVGCHDCSEGDQPDQLVALSLKTGREAVVARTAYRGGMMDWAEGSRDTIVYTDQNREQSDDNWNAIWTLYARHLPDGRTRVLDSSHGKANAYLPIVRAGDGYAVWANQDPTSPSSEDLKVGNLETGRVAVVARGVHPKDFGITSGRAFYSDSAGNVQSVSLSGTDPATIYAQGQAGNVRTSDPGTVIWPEPAKNDPQSLWEYGTATGGQPREFYQGYNEQAVSGSTFAAFSSEDDSGRDTVMAVPLSGGSAITLATNQYVPSRIAANGDLVAFATISHMDSPNQVTTIHVDAVHVS